MWKTKKLETEDAATESVVSRSEAVSHEPRGTISDGSSEQFRIGDRSAVASPQNSRSLLGSNLKIKGEISGTEDLQLDCSVDGTIRLTGRKLTVGATAKIVADIFAGEVVVLGDIKGNLSATDRIEIKSNGSVVGEMTTSRIAIEDGAYFKGTIAIDRKVPIPITETLHTRPATAEANATPHLSGGTPTLHLTPSNKERPSA
jgi:cytoskeletal protein CcmA (bactofilin family)